MLFVAVAAYGQGGEVMQPGVYQDGISVVKQNGKYGLIDVTHRVFTPVIYESVSPFVDGLAKVKRDGRYGFVNTLGLEVVAPVYDSITPFQNGVAKVKKNGYYGLINRGGKEVASVAMTSSPTSRTGWPRSGSAGAAA